METGAVAARSRGKRCDERRSPLIAQIVDENLSRSLFLRHVRHIAIRSRPLDGSSHRVREFGDEFPVVFPRYRHDEVQPFSARGFDEAFQSQFLEKFSQLQCAGDDLLPANLRRRIEIEDDSIGPFQFIAARTPDVDFQRGDLSQRDQTLHIFDDDIFFLARFVANAERAAIPSARYRPDVFGKSMRLRVPPGQRTIDSGRSTTCGNIQSATST